TSGRSSRSTAIGTNEVFRIAATSGDENDSCCMTWHPGGLQHAAKVTLRRSNGGLRAECVNEPFATVFRNGRQKEKKVRPTVTGVIADTEKDKTIELLRKRQRGRLVLLPCNGIVFVTS